jgi:hypothetical protein
VQEPLFFSALDMTALLAARAISAGDNGDGAFRECRGMGLSFQVFDAQSWLIVPERQAE